jgi:hypothetical protein
MRTGAEMRIRVVYFFAQRVKHGSDTPESRQSGSAKDILLGRNAESFSQFSQHVVVLKHEAHAVRVFVSSADTLPERHGQLLKSVQQDVGQDCAFRVTPKLLD